MHSTLNPNETDPHDMLVIAPDVVLVAPGDKEFSSLPYDVMNRPSDPQAHMRSTFSPGPSVPPVDTTFRATAVNHVQLPGDRPSIARRAIRGLFGLLFTVCIGIAAVVWQSYGDAAKEIVAKWAPPFALTSSPPESRALPDQPSPPAIQASATETAPPQPAPPAQTPDSVAPTATAQSPEAAPSLQSMARDLATMGHEIEQLKASIEQLKTNREPTPRDIARVPEQNLKPRVSVSARPPRFAAVPARKPMPPLFPPPRAAAIATLPQAPAPPQQPALPQQPAPPPQATAQPQDEPVPRPPMPVR